jgi:HAMP domain-containing protein
MKGPSLTLHPEEEQLLRFLDGELPANATSEVRSHLEACWQCREQLEQLQNTVGECVRYRKNILQRHLPPPPAPWTDIYRGFGQIDAALAQASLRERLARVLRAPAYSVKRWAAVAVAIMAICVLFYRFRQTPPVQAAELLRKAIAAADAHPGKPHRIQIRTRDRSLTRVSGAADTDALSSLQVLFREAHYDWDDPLSAKSYLAWRDSLVDKRDAVTEERDAYRIRTDTGSGQLMAATLKIRTQDLRPVAERLEFRNREWVEITELAGEAEPPVLIAAADGSAAGNPVKTPSSISPSPATIGDELHVLASLHRVGADLGDPIEVSRAGGDVLVAGVGIAPQRQQEIHDALGAQKHVVVRFSEPAQARLEPEQEAPPENATSANIQQLQARMAEQIGGRVYFSQLAAQVLDLSEPMMARAYALRRLAERIPSEVEAELSAQDRQLLRSLQQEHTEALRRQIVEIDRLLRPALESVIGVARASPDGITSSSAEELFQSARRVEKLLAVMFGAAAAESPGDQVPSQLLSNLAQLRARVEAYDRLRSDK